MDPTRFGRHLKAALVLAEMTASELAAEIEEDLGFGVATLERIMQGKRRPRPVEIPRLAQALGVPASFLVHGPASAAPASRGEDNPIDVLKRSLDQIRSELRARDRDLVQELRRLRDQVSRSSTQVPHPE